MKSKKPRTIKFRRKREHKTDYNNRLRLLVSNKARLVIRKSINNVIAQIISYGDKGDVVQVSATSKELKKLGYNLNTGNIPASYLTGLLIAKKALKKGVKEAIVDIGINTSVKGSRLYAAVKGAIEAGLKIPCSKEILPNDDAVNGKIIADYVQKAKGGQFNAYKKNGVNPNSIIKNIEEVKKKILG